MNNFKAADVVVTGEGPGTTVYGFQLQTPAAHAWVEAHLHVEDWQWLGSHTIGIEHRYAMDITTAMIRDGLRVE